MNERKRRHSQNNHFLREIMERLREYEPDEVIIICNKFRQRRGLPPLEGDLPDKFIAGEQPPPTPETPPSPR
ncbi:MAG: hypothetical protein LBS30_01180 [Planctomycetota bacterium]|jgi:hypothetical protein|nr:hypothetical protein [Planctomycetota bacterium]